MIDAAGKSEQLDLVPAADAAKRHEQCKDADEEAQSAAEPR